MSLGTLTKYEASPVDTTSAAAICDRLADIEDRMAFVTNELSRAAYWRKQLTRTLELLETSFYPSTSGTIPERKAQLARLVEDDIDGTPHKLAEAEAQYALYVKEFEGLDGRRSILQSCLKVHVREMEPRFGEGSHNR